MYSSENPPIEELEEENQETEDISEKPKLFIPKKSHKKLVHGEIEEIVFCGEGMKKAILLTNKGIVYQTTDFGMKWTEKKPEFDLLHSRLNMFVVGLL